MDIQAYITSGIIEAYVLGLASPDEVREVEMYATQYTEVKKALTDFEIALESQAMESAIQPPVYLKQKIMAAITSEKSSSVTTTSSKNINQDQPQAKIVPITAAPKSIRWLRGAVAASVILLLGSAILNFYYYSRYKEYYTQYTKVNNDYNTLLAQNNTLIAKTDAFQVIFKEINDSSVIKIPMQAASPERPGLLATVYWNKQSKDVFLAVNNLPKPPAGKQYQLWAVDVVNGQLSPADAGMLNLNLQPYEVVRMKKSEKAQKFAITLEKEGGVPSPTLSELQVIGGI